MNVAPFRYSLVNPCGDWQCVHGNLFVFPTSQEQADLRNEPRVCLTHACWEGECACTL